MRKTMFIGALIATVVLTVSFAHQAFAQFGPPQGGPGGFNGGPAVQGGQTGFVGGPGAQGMQGGFTGSQGVFGGPMGMMAMMPPAPAIMQAGVSGLYVLDGGILAKYDDTLKQSAKVTLVDTTAARPMLGAAPQPGGVTTMPAQFPAGPPPQGALYVAGSATDIVLVVLGDTFYNVNGETMAITVKTTLPAPQRPGGAMTTGPAVFGNPGAMNAGGAMGMGMQQDDPAQDNPPPLVQGFAQSPAQGFMMMSPPQPPVGHTDLEVRGNILFILRGTQLLAVNIPNGAIVGQTTTPAAPKVSSIGARAHRR